MSKDIDDLRMLELAACTLDNSDWNTDAKTVRQAYTAWPDVYPL